MSSSKEAGTFVGTVTELDVGGNGPGSAQLEFSVTPLNGGGEPATFVVLFGAEPQVFAAMSTLLTAAYVGKFVVTVEYLSLPGATPNAINVKIGEKATASKAGRMGFV